MGVLGASVLTKRRLVSEEGRRAGEERRGKAA